MDSLGLQTIPLASIDIGARLRPVSEPHAAMLAENIQQTGRLRAPIEVRETGERYSLISGRHRMRAAELLDWAEIPAFVFQATDDEAQLAEIDENLVRHELNPLDRAVFLFQREQIFKRLHPETVAGVAGAEARHRATEIISFARDTAQRVGLTERTIYLATSIARDLSPEVRALIAGTALAQKQSELLALAKVPADLQLAVANLVLGGTCRNVATARDAAEGRARETTTEEQAQLNRLLTAWRKAGPSARGAFRAFIGEEKREAA